MSHEFTVNPYENIEEQQYAMRKSSRGSSISNIANSDINSLAQSLGSVSLDLNQLTSPVTSANKNIHYVFKENSNAANTEESNSSNEKSNIAKPETPSQITHHDDFDDDDEDSDESKNSTPSKSDTLIQE